MRLVAAVLSAALALAYSSLTFAQPAASPASAGDQEAAKAHFLAGSAYYEQANYRDAVKEFNEAHRLSGRADLLYNIALCYERLDQLDQAIATLRQYLRDKADAPDRNLIDERIRNLERRELEQVRTAPVMAERAPPPPPPPSGGHHFRDVMPAVVVGSIGAAILVAALGTGLAAHSIHDDLQAKCPMNMCANDPALRDERDRGQALALSSDVLLAVGAAALATGVVLLIVELRRPPARIAQLLPAVGGLAVRW